MAISAKEPSSSPLPPVPGDFEQRFLDDLPYEPAVLLFDRLLEIDAAASRVRCRMPTDRPIPFTIHQRAHAARHPRHVAGAAMIHATGMLGFVHAYYLLGLRHAEGWIGYGTHIHSATFRKLVGPGVPMECSCTATKVRAGKSRYVVRYEFEFLHEGDVCYEGDQTAVWSKIAT